MKEDQIKKIIQKSTVETSDDFINTLMQLIEAEEKVKPTSVWWSFRTILILCSLLTMIITLGVFRFSTMGMEILNIGGIPKTPVFIVVTVLLLCLINHLIRVSENQNSVSQ